MKSPREYSNIESFLGDQGGISTEKLESNLSSFPDEILQKLDNRLETIDIDQEPTKDWKNDIKSGQVHSVLAELDLIYYLRSNFEEGSLELNAKPEGSNQDFDIKFEIKDKKIWIEITREDFLQRYNLGGFGSNTKSNEKIERKIADKKDALDSVKSSDYKILAVYTEATIIQDLTIGKAIEEKGVYNKIDGLVTFASFSDSDINVNFRPMNDRGLEISNFFKN